MDQLTDEQFSQQVLNLVKREFGADGLAQFLRLYPLGSGDYTRDRDLWLGDLTIDEVLDSIEKRHRSPLKA